MHREVLSRGKLRHGKSHTPAWKAWRRMMTRCKYPAHDHFQNYGGRGIQVCESWKVFENFYADMGDPPEGYSLERRDVNGNYEPGNCEWIPSRDQYLNKTDTVYVDFYGDRVPFVSLVRQSGINHKTAYARIFRYGWTAERAFPNIKP